MIIGIYILKNKINHKCYVGQSWNIKRRLAVHRSSKVKTYISNAIKKYGWKAFDIDIIPLLEVVNQDALNELECQYIKLHNSLAPCGYNLKTGGSNGKHSEETRCEMSKARKGKPAWNKGKKLPPQLEESNQKRSNKLKGRISPTKGTILSDGRKQQLSQAHKGKKLKYNPETGKREWDSPSII